MSPITPTLTPGDRVRASHRPGFPDGTVVKILEGGFVLVRWDGDVLETAHPRELTKLAPDSTGR
jgi:hypothetical protein